VVFSNAKLWAVVLVAEVVLYIQEVVVSLLLHQQHQSPPSLLLPLWGV
jgi:hypothetical protein